MILGIRGLKTEEFFSIACLNMSNTIISHDNDIIATERTYCDINMHYLN